MREGFTGQLLTLFAVFAPLSLLSFGGSNSVIADIAHQSVAVQHWTSEREFADLFVEFDNRRVSLRTIGAEFLGGVIEMRQIDQRQRWIEFPIDVLRGVGDPLG